MAIQSAVSYVISEEQDGFVAVDFHLIDGHDDEIRDWEIVDDCSSTDEISVEDLKSLPEYSPEMFASHRQSIEYVPGGEDDDLCENGEDLRELSKPVPGMIIGDGEVESLIARQHQLDYELCLIRSYREEEEEEEEVDYDLDDELVPYSAKVKLGRERMRKLGKRSCSKSVKSKRLSYNYNKPGCVRGKYGLGLKHSLI